MADAPTGDIRESILAEIAASKTVAPAEAAQVEAEAAEDVEAAPAEEVEQDASAGESDESEVDAAPDDGGDELELTSSDPKEQKLLDNVRRQEKRMRALSERRDAEFHAERVKWQAQVDRVAEIDKLAGRMKYDPVAVLRALGATDEDFETIAQAAYSESPRGAKEPGRKEAAAAALREREKLDKMTATEKRLADLEAKLEQERLETRAQQEAAQYMQQVTSAAAAKFPLVAAMFKADPEMAEEGMLGAFDRLAKKTGRAPKPAEVAAEFNRRETARLKAHGFDPTAKTKPAAAAPKPANTNAPAPTETAKPTNGKRLSPDEERAAILAELEAERAKTAKTVTH